MEKPIDKKAEEYMAVMEGVPAFVDFAYWENLQERRIILNTPIDQSIVEYVIMQILKFNREDENKTQGSRKPIEIYINSGGGSTMDGFGAIDAIKTSKTPVYTICLGIAASMAGLILMAGHKRFAYKNSTILIHDGELTVQSTSKKAKQTMSHFDKLGERVGEFIIENTKISKELYDEKQDQEWWMFGDEALELGIIDEIIK